MRRDRVPRTAVEPRSPARARARPRSPNTAAPRKWSDPATTSTRPKVYLCASIGRGAAPQRPRSVKAPILQPRMRRAGCQCRARPGGRRARRAERSSPRLTAPSVTVVSHAPRRRALARVGVDAARDVERDDFQVRRRVEHARHRASGSRRARGADAADGVEPPSRSGAPVAASSRAARERQARAAISSAR